MVVEITDRQMKWVSGGCIFAPYSNTEPEKTCPACEDKEVDE
jgi:hypothetical protein